MSYSKIEELIFITFITLFILAMTAFIVVILFFVQKKQKGYSTDLTAVKANYDRELFKAQLEIQEATFKEIAREIHDNVGQILSLARLGLGTLDLDQKEDSLESIAEISHFLEQALGDLRNMARNMNSENIINSGLQKSIEMQVGFLKREGKFNVNLCVEGILVKLNETKEIIFFRILQEAVNNIIRHSAATEIGIALSYKKECVQLQIRDNGKGFNLDETLSGVTHINGLYNMQHRAKIIDGEFTIESVKGRGTIISVTTPY